MCSRLRVCSFFPFPVFSTADDAHHRGRDGPGGGPPRARLPPGDGALLRPAGVAGAPAGARRPRELRGRRAGPGGARAPRRLRAGHPPPLPRHQGGPAGGEGRVDEAAPRARHGRGRPEGGVGDHLVQGVGAGAEMQRRPGGAGGGARGGGDGEGGGPDCAREGGGGAAGAAQAALRGAPVSARGVDVASSQPSRRVVPLTYHIPCSRPVPALSLPLSRSRPACRPAPRGRGPRPGCRP